MSLAALGPTALNLLSAARRLWFLVVAMVGFGLLLAHLWIAQQPTYYRATVRLRYTLDQGRPLGHEVHDVADPMSNYWATHEFIATQNEVLRSRPVVLAALTTLEGLAPEQIPSQQLEAAVGSFQSSVTVSPQPETYLTYVTLTDRDEQRAVSRVNGLVRAYLTYASEERRRLSSAAIVYLNEQVETVGREVSASQTAMLDFLDERNAPALSESDTSNLVTANLSQLGGALNEARIEAIDVRSRLAGLRTLEGASDQTLLDINIGTDSPELTALRQSLGAKLAELHSLSTRYGSGHPRISELTAELQTLRNELQQEARVLIQRLERRVRELERNEQGLGAAAQSANRQAVDRSRAMVEYARLRREHETRSELYSRLVERAAEASLLAQLHMSYVEVLEPAVSASPVSVRVWVAYSMGAVLAFGVAVALLFGLTQLDRRIRRPEELEGIGVPVLGPIPHLNNLNRMFEVGSPQNRLFEEELASVEEAANALRTRLALVSNTAAKSLLVTSGKPGDGKTFVASQLARAFARTGSRVLLVDADLRRPTTHRVFRVNNRNGLSDVLMGKKAWSAVIKASDLKGLDLLTAGPPPSQPVGLFFKEEFSALVTELEAKYDLVIFDSSPVLSVSDPALIARQVDGVVVVFRAASATRESSLRLLAHLTESGSPVIGTVLNDIPRADDYYNYSYATDNAEEAAE